MGTGQGGGFISQALGILFNWRKLSILILTIIIIMNLSSPIIQSIKEKSPNPFIEALGSKIIATELQLYEKSLEFREYVITDTNLWGFVKRYFDFFSIFYLMGVFIYVLVKIATIGNSTMGIGIAILLFVLYIVVQGYYFEKNDIEPTFFKGTREFSKLVLDGTFTRHYGATPLIIENRTISPIENITRIANGTA